MNFSDLAAATDQAVLDACGDPAVLDGSPARILYCAPWLEPRVGTLRTDITQPMAFMPSANLGAAGPGSVLAYGDTDYDVVAVEPDGAGWVGLVLRER